MHAHPPASTAPPRRRWPHALAGCLLVAVPPLLVTYPPITDLPQQMAQVPLLAETLSGAAPEYRVQWLAPNKLSYPLLAIPWLLLGPLAAVKVATILLAAVWVLSVHWLAARRGRSLAAASLAAIFLFNHFFYMGFFNFLVGLPAFALWLHEVEPDEDRSPGRLALGAGVAALLLYLSHVLWLAAGLAWWGLVSLVDRPPWRRLAARAAGTAPVLALVLSWYPSLSRQGWDSLSAFGPPVLARLSFAGLTEWALGGVHGSLEPAAMLAVAAWIALALWQHRRRLAEAVDRRLLAAALFLFLAGLILPDKVDRTLQFASRWTPVAWALLLLALPAPAVRPLVRRAAALGLLASFCLATGAVWIAFERDELRGFRGSLAALTARPRVLGLDFVRTSPRMKSPTYLQLPAYAQLVHGGRLGFSFVNLASSLVVKRDMAARDPWTPGLEWLPQRLRMSDLDHFDFALVHAPADVQAQMAARDARLVPASAPAPWRLFRIERPAGASQP